MKCYFYGAVNSDDPLITQEGVVSFAIPDIGIVFKSRWIGNLIDCQYAALISLLGFIESNPDLFKNKNAEIYSDASVVIYQLTKEAFIYDGIKKYFDKIKTYKSKFPFVLRWLPQSENLACSGLVETPPIKPSVNINYGIANASKSNNRQGGVLPL